MSEAAQGIDAKVKQLRIRFVEQIANDDVAWMTFKDPGTRYAVQVEFSAGKTKKDAGGALGEILDVLLLQPSASPQTAQSSATPGFSDSPGDPSAPPPLFIKYRGVELTWRPGRATLQCEPDQAELLLSAIVEFTHYERELCRIEDEIADAWPELEEDKALAFEVTPAGLGRSKAVGARMERVLQQRIRYARIEPHLYEPDAGSPAATQKLGEELRSKARIESRLETVDGQLEVFENVYELSSQRMGEYRAAREEHVLEWIIIVVLGLEVLLMLAQTFWKHIA